MIHPYDLTISVCHVKSQASQMFVEQNFLPNLKIKCPYYCPFVKRRHRSHVKADDDRSSVPHQAIIWTNAAVLLTHWGRVTHICVIKLNIVDSDNGLSPGRHQAIIWTNAGILLIGPFGTNFSEILFGIQTSSFKKQVGGRSWIYVPHVNLRAARRFTCCP